MPTPHDPMMTTAQCDRLHSVLQLTLAQQFEALHDRLHDLQQKVGETNGRLRTVEQAVVQNDERWRSHDRTSADDVRRDAANDADMIQRERLRTGETANITRRDVQLVLVTVGAIGTLLATLRWLWPLLHRAFVGP